MRQKRINNYFNLLWIEVVKAALSDFQQEMLAESQFRQLMLMGAHTFFNHVRPPDFVTAVGDQKTV